MWWMVLCLGFQLPCSAKLEQQLSALLPVLHAHLVCSVALLIPFFSLQCFNCSYLPPPENKNKKVLFLWGLALMMFLVF